MDKNRILIIEDEASIRELLAMNLEAVGYKVDLAEDGVKAEQKILADQGLYDLALVDVMLPGPGGFDLIGSLNQKEIPCIFLTAKADVASKVKGLRLGAEDYMVKPFEMMELFARVLIARNPAPSPDNSMITNFFVSFIYTLHLQAVSQLWNSLYPAPSL